MYDPGPCKLIAHHDILAKTIFITFDNKKNSKQGYFLEQKWRTAFPSEQKSGMVFVITFALNSLHKLAFKRLPPVWPIEEYFGHPNIVNKTYPPVF